MITGNSDSEWEVVQCAVEILWPLYEATKEVSAEKYVTGSKVIAITKNLLGWYSTEMRRHQNNGDTTGNGYLLSKFLLDSLNKRFQCVEDVKELALSTMLDPRFKRQGFRIGEKADKAIKWLKEELNEAPLQNESNPQERASDYESGSAAKKSLWSTFDSEVAARRELPVPNSDTRAVEMRRYLELANLERQVDILKWWGTEEKSNFPQLSKVAQKYIIIQGTSVPSERVFSAAGGIITAKRSRISDKNAAMFIFLNANM